MITLKDKEKPHDKLASQPPRFANPRRPGGSWCYFQARKLSTVKSSTTVKSPTTLSGHGAKTPLGGDNRGRNSACRAILEWFQFRQVDSGAMQEYQDSLLFEFVLSAIIISYNTDGQKSVDIAQYL